MQTIRSQYMSGTLLWVHAKTQPDDAEWAAQMKAATELGTRVRRILVFADVALTARQRRQVADMIKANQVKATAIITSSRVTRMIVTALSWLGGPHRAFDPSEISAALDHLEIPQGERAELLATAARFARELNDDSLEHTLAAR